MQQETYEAPTIEEIASVHELTLTPHKHGKNSDGYGMTPHVNVS